MEAIFALTEGGLNIVQFGSSFKHTKKKSAESLYYR